MRIPCILHYTFVQPPSLHPGGRGGGSGGFPYKKVADARRFASECKSRTLVLLSVFRMKRLCEFLLLKEGNLEELSRQG